MSKLSLGFLIAIAACGSKQPAPSNPPPPAGSAAQASDPTCPLEVPGTSLTVEDTASGAALVFVTTGDKADLSKRAQAFAAMHNQHNGPGNAMGMMFPQSWKATAHDIDGGARVEFAGDDPAVVQSQLRMHAGHMSSGSCAM